MTFQGISCRLNSAHAYNISDDNPAIFLGMLFKILKDLTFEFFSIISWLSNW